jgi:hypothetical protein
MSGGGWKGREEKKPGLSIRLGWIFNNMLKRFHGEGKGTRLKIA